MHRWVFLAEGPVHTAAFGALAGCLCLAGRRTAQLPDHLATAGLVAATAGVLSPLSLITKPAVWLMPAGSMSGLAVKGIAGVVIRSAQEPVVVNLGRPDGEPDPGQVQWGDDIHPPH